MILAKGWRRSIVQTKRKSMARGKNLWICDVRTDYDGLKKSRRDERLRETGCLTIQIL